MEVRIAGISTVPRLFSTVLAAVSLLLLCTTGIPLAQTGMGSSPPPTYDWDDNVPGIQGPTSPQLAGAEYRRLQTFRVFIPVRVPLAELQAALPPGFNAVPSPAGSNTAQVSLDYGFQIRETRIADGTTVGGSVLQYLATVSNTNLTPPRQEVGFLGRECSTQELVDFYNAAFGAGSARLGKVNIHVAENAGALSFQSTVTDDDIGLNLAVQATSPDPLVGRSKSDPFGVNRDLLTGRSWFAATQRDSRAVPQAMASLKVETPDGRLIIPVGGGGTRSLTITGFGNNVTFQRNSEAFDKFE